MPSHLRMVLTRTSEVIPVAGGRMQLGTWQGIPMSKSNLPKHADMQRERRGGSR